jgi:predicted nuclease of predicted toxin-antitoxin system
MRFLAHENIPGVAVTALAADGHDVAWVRSIAPGIPDSDVLAWAVREDRILLTFDKDFGDLARNATLPGSCGVILFRIPAPHTDKAGAQFAASIASRRDWAGYFSVIEPDRVRMRPLNK